MISFKLEGLRELEAQLEQLGAELAIKSLRSAIRQAFKPVLETAVRMVPKDSGALAGSLKLKVIRRGATMAVGIMIGKVSAPEGELPPARRWHFVEFGTAKMAAHPYLRPALDSNAERVLGLLKTELQKSIQRAIKRRAKGA